MKVFSVLLTTNFFPQRTQFKTNNFSLYVTLKNAYLKLSLYLYLTKSGQFVLIKPTR